MSHIRPPTIENRQSIVSNEHQNRAYPSVESLRQELGDSPLPRPLLVYVIRREVNRMKQSDRSINRNEIISKVREVVAMLEQARLRPVINATGVIVHTNLGRSPLGSSAVAALEEIGGSYNNLEYDLASGQRGGRAAYLEAGLATLCESEAATLVNNCAAALVLALKEFTAEHNEVIVSRGELVQIGGGFRIPDILESSGAKLREVGTTNQTNLSDYKNAIGENTGLILKVHRSNFFMDGFVASPTRSELANLAHERGVPLMEDLGSGALVDTARLADLDHEPTPSDAIRGGVDLVCFSGDKLMGGPQAGILAGSAELISRIKRNPFFRALRCDRLVMTAMQAVVDSYLRKEEIPVLEMMQTTIDRLKERAEHICSELIDLPVRVETGEGKAQVGGGTLPRESIPSVTVDLSSDDHSAAELETLFRSADPPIIGYPSKKKFKLDLRTVFPNQDEVLIEQTKRFFS